MSKISIVKLSEVQKESEETRIEADFFKKDLLESEKKILKLKWAYLKNLVKENTRYKQPIYDKESDITILNSQYIRDYEIDYEIAKKGYSKLVPFESVMINSTGVGTLGRVNINYLKNIRLSVDSHVNIVITKDSLNPYFLMVFLKTNFGQNQIERRFKGSSGQIEIYSSDFDLFKIPLLSSAFQKKIESLVKDSYSKLQKSKIFYKEAEEILLKELNILNQSWKGENISIISLKETMKLGRIDAEYFQPRFKYLDGKVISYKRGFKRLFKFLKEEPEKGRLLDYSENSKGNKKSYILIENLRGSEYKFFSSERRGILCNKEDILIVGDGENSGLVGTNLKGFVGSTLLKLSINYSDINHFSFLKILEIYFKKLNYLKTGSGVPHLDKNILLNLKIPLLPPEIQEKISSKIQESFKLRKESKELLEKGKKMVEDEIEKEAKKGEIKLRKK